MTNSLFAIALGIKQEAGKLGHLLLLFDWTGMSIEDNTKHEVAIYTSHCVRCGHEVELAVMGDKVIGIDENSVRILKTKCHDATPAAPA